MAAETPGFPEDLFQVAFADHWNDEAKARWREDSARAHRMGMREGVFAKVGDSNLAAYNSLYGLGCLEPVWDRHAHLEPVLRRYRRAEVPPGDDPASQIRPAEPEAGWNSFNRASAATRSMINGEHLLEPSGRFSGGLLGWLPDSANPPEESMLNCELRLLRPGFAFVNIGTNGQNYGMTPDQTASQAADVVKEIKRLGTVPVVMTIPPQLDRGEKQGRWDFARETSKALGQVAREARAPLFDQWSVLADERLVNHGMAEFDTGHFDGFHLETPGGFREPDSLERSVDFRPEALLYGANLRNLLLLMTLEALDEALEDK